MNFKFKRDGIFSSEKAIKLRAKKKYYNTAGFQSGIYFTEQLQLQNPLFK